MKAQKLFTLIIIRQNNSVLLGHKVRGFGKGLWNGFGGKVEKNESVQEGALRELKEESNLDAVLNHVGVVTYYLLDKPLDEVVHIYTSSKFSGDIIESEEMAPIKWYNEKDIPYGKMWPDAPSWLPLLLNGNYFTVDVSYKNDEIQEIGKNTFHDYNDLMKNIKQKGISFVS